MIIAHYYVGEREPLPKSDVFKIVTTNPEYVFIQNTINERRIRLLNCSDFIQIVPMDNMLYAYGNTPVQAHFSKIEPTIGSEIGFDVDVENDGYTMNPKMYKTSHNKSTSVLLYLEFSKASFIPMEYCFNTDNISIKETWCTKDIVGMLLHVKIISPKSFQLEQPIDITIKGSHPMKKPVKYGKLVIGVNPVLDTVNSQCVTSVPTTLTTIKRSSIKGSVQQVRHPKISTKNVSTKVFCGKKPFDEVEELISKLPVVDPLYIHLPIGDDDEVQRYLIDNLQTYAPHVRAITIVGDDVRLNFRELRKSKIRYVFRLRDNGTLVTIKSN